MDCVDFVPVTFLNILFSFLNILLFRLYASVRMVQLFPYEGLIFSASAGPTTLLVAVCTNVSMIHSLLPHQTWTYLRIAETLTVNVISWKL